MESRTNGSYVYFLIDDNLIYTYKMDTDTYITLHDIKNTKNSALYEIKSRQEFQCFEHKSREAVEGVGFFLDEESVKEMVTHINKAKDKSRRQ
jgi:hypothetical protein